MDFVTISQTGNAVDFGDLAQRSTFHGTSASSTRGIIAGGISSLCHKRDSIYYILMTTGDAHDFGDLGNRQVVLEVLAIQLARIIA